MFPQNTIKCLYGVKDINSIHACLNISGQIAKMSRLLYFSAKITLSIYYEIKM